MFKTYRVGTVLGFPIEVNLSFLLLLGFILLWAGGLAGLFIALLAFGSVLLHELGHALVARHLGVPVPGIELHFFGGAAKMGSQPKSAKDEIAIAAAGPVVSFVLAGVSALLFAVSGFWLFYLLAYINLMLGGFNLMPALPMDGGRILRALLTRKFSFVQATEIAVTVSRGFSILFAVVGLAIAHIFMVLLAVVLWMMASAERRMARFVGYGGHGQPVQVLPRGYSPTPGHQTGVHFQRPVATGGFVIRRCGNRFVIEPIQ